MSLTHAFLFQRLLTLFFHDVEETVVVGRRQQTVDEQLDLFKTRRQGEEEDSLALHLSDVQGTCTDVQTDNILRVQEKKWSSGCM